MCATEPSARRPQHPCARQRSPQETPRRSRPLAGVLDPRGADLDQRRILHILVYPTGEWAARLLILALAVTPLMLLFKGRALVRWLRRNRRYFGVAACAYAATHSAFYLADKASLDRVVSELPPLYVWTGWLAFAILVPTFVHWASLHQWGHPLNALLHVAPLAALEAHRMWYWWSRRHRPAAA